MTTTRLKSRFMKITCIGQLSNLNVLDVVSYRLHADVTLLCEHIIAERATRKLRRSSSKSWSHKCKGWSLGTPLYLANNVLAITSVPDLGSPFQSFQPEWYLARWRSSARQPPMSYGSDPPWSDSGTWPYAPMTSIISKSYHALKISLTRYTRYPLRSYHRTDLPILSNALSTHHPAKSRSDKPQSRTLSTSHRTAQPPHAPEYP